MPLHTLYAEVCEHNPKCAVPGLEYLGALGGAPIWSLCGYGFSESIVAALILAHWVGMLPRGCGIRTRITDGAWYVIDPSGLHPTMSATPLEALAAYFLAQPKGTGANNED